MKDLKLVDGIITIDIQSMMEYMDDESIKQFLQIAAFRDVLANFVMGHILEDVCYDDGWYIGDLGQKLRLQLIPLMEPIILNIVRDLIIKVKQTEKESNRQRAYAHHMGEYARNVRDMVYRLLKNGSDDEVTLSKIMRESPQQPKFESTSHMVTEKEITDVLEGKFRL